MIFFIETSLIGNLAKNFINKILADISELTPGKISDYKTDTFTSRINMIDEPVIRQLLMNELKRAGNA